MKLKNNYLFDLKKLSLKEKKNFFYDLLTEKKVKFIYLLLHSEKNARNGVYDGVLLHKLLGLCGI